MSINPNDPVVAILQQAVQGLRAELEKQQEELDQAMRVFATGVGQMIGQLGSRIAVLEARMGDTGGGPAPLPAHEGGKEL